MRQRSCCLLVMVMLLACCTGQALGEDKKGGVSAPSSMSIDEARNVLQTELTSGKYAALLGDTEQIGRVKITPSKFSIQDSHVVRGEREGRWYAFDFKKMGSVKVEHHMAFRSIKVDWGGKRPAEFLLKGYSEETVDRLASALNVLIASVAAPPSPDKDPAFQTVVNSYRSAPVKPAFPEEARKFKVQAEAAVSEKQFEEAEDLYREALEVAPWWPEGHFNRALVLAELNEFPTAIVEMQRYVALVPDAQDARAAQDKIYVWESKAKEAAASADTQVKRKRK